MQTLQGQCYVHTWIVPVVAPYFLGDCCRLLHVSCCCVVTSRHSSAFCHRPLGVVLQDPNIWPEPKRYCTVCSGAVQREGLGGFSYTPWQPQPPSLPTLPNLPSPTLPPPPPPPMTFAQFLMLLKPFKGLTFPKFPRGSTPPGPPSLWMLRGSSKTQCCAIPDVWTCYAIQLAVISTSWHCDSEEWRHLDILRISSWRQYSTTWHQHVQTVCDVMIYSHEYDE